MSLSQLSIRPAVVEDTALIFNFIKELAEFEKLSHEVKATEEELKKSIFGDKPECEVILAFWGKDPVGFALFFHNYSTFLSHKGLYLEDLYVKPQARGKGVGKALLKHLAQIALNRNCKRFEWWVLDWNQKAIEFYKSLGARAMDEWTVFRVDGQKLIDLANC